MSAEEELPEELSKLKIAPILSYKLLDGELSIERNPFFENDQKNSCTDFKNQYVASPTNLSNTIQYSTQSASNCHRCRYRRASESVLDELKYISTTATIDSPQCTRTPSNGVLKQTLKKCSSSAGGPWSRKIVLREPVLKALQTCLHPHSNVRRKLLALAAPNTVIPGNEGSLSTKGISDFRDLIDECHNLLSKDVDFTGRLNQLCLSSRNSKNFTTMQIPKSQSGTKIRNNKKQLLNPTMLSTTSSSLEENHSLCHNTISTNFQQRGGNSVSPEHASHARCSTSCSQQAGNSTSSGSTCDDVTIDELASYFDTFVHIPKKMSTMAEMMYI